MRPAAPAEPARPPVLDETPTGPITHPCAHGRAPVSLLPPVLAGAPSGGSPSGVTAGAVAKPAQREGRGEGGGQGPSSRERRQRPRQLIHM